MRKLGAFVLLVAGWTLSRATSNFHCARYCKEDGSTFGYAPGKIYTYQYAGSARSLVNTTTSHHVVDQSGVRLEGVVAFQSLSNCDFVMQVLQVRVVDYHIKSSQQATSSEGKFAQLERALTARPLHFAFNGRIDTICPEAGETKAVVDIKRAILTAFQNSNPTFKSNALVYETDITGNCETHYHVTPGQDGVRMVHKTKNLDACDHRIANYFSWQTVPYAATAHAKSLPLLKSSLDCVLEYGDVLLAATCKEKHVFQPFSNGDHGALTAVEQQLRFLEARQAPSKPVETPKHVQRSTLIYEYDDDQRAANDPRTAINVLKQLERKTADGVEMDVSRVFSQLVYEFQRLSKSDLLEIFAQITAKQRLFYVDAISLITTNAGIEAMTDLYETKQLDDAQMNSWLVSVNFIKHPNMQTVKLIHPLVFRTKIKRNALLSLSSVLYKYCSKQECLENVVILDIVKHIEKPISNNCVLTSETDKREMLMALKAIGNAGLTTSYYNLQKCYLHSELPVELRIAAIAAHRRMKCATNENLDDLKRLLSNARANSEVRIAAYLASMRCASYASFAQVKDVLVKEEANQVGAFIWTHLTNLQETSVPWKQGVRKLLENEFLQNKFNTDPRRYSRNFEASTFFDSAGVGGGVEANVIFTSESYLPRSAMLNFTLDLFGETINVLEVGTRVVGFEDIVESFFNSEEASGAAPEVEDRSPSAKQERIDEFGEVFKVPPRQPSGSGYVKMFGNEILYAEFTSPKEVFGASLSGKVVLDVLAQLMKAPDIDYTKSFSILDSTYRVPTILGFPLQLKANATATLGLTAGGEVDVQDIRSHKMLIKGRVYPSVSVQVAGTMSVDTYRGEAGVQYLGALKSNMYVDGHLHLERGRLMDVKVNVPKKQMDIFTVTSDLYLLHNDESFPVQDVSDQVDHLEYCTDQHIGKVIGLQFCNQWRFVNATTVASPSFPLTGSFKYSMHVKKTDTFEFYKLYVETRLVDPSQQYLVDFLVDTPNSKVDRKLQCTLAADLQALTLSARMHSPFANFQLNSSIERELPKYKFQLMSSFNGKEVVTLMSTFDVKDEGETLTYEPLAKINYREQQIVALTGKLSKVKGGEYTADLKLQGVADDAVQISGNFICDTNYLTIKTNITSKHFKGNLDAGLNARPNEMTAQATLNYSYKNLATEVLRFMGRLNRSQSDTMDRHLLQLDVNSSEWPSYNTHMQWENQRGYLYFNNTVEVMFFESTWRTHQIVKLDKGFCDEAPDMLLLADLQSPQNTIDYQCKLQFSMSKEHLKGHALFQVNKVQRSEALVEYTSNTSHATLNVLLYYRRKSWRLDGVLNEVLPGNYLFDVTCRHNAFEQEHVILTVQGDYQNISFGDLQTHRLNCTLDLPERDEHWKTPWIITSTVQKSHATFLSVTKLHTKEADYAGHFNWIEDSLSLSIRANDKQLFVLNAAKTEELVSIIMALNIHQHFELNTRLIAPFQRFDLQVYWDKDRDESQRFLFSIEQNAFKGQYNMKIEYPNQRIITNILLIPTQVIMNVTWGIEISQRIYLKVGNKHYDDGGIWFGELETPFNYLEKQQFQLQYSVVSDSFDVQSDLSWRAQSIKLLVAGSRSDTHLRGNLQLNTTLPEIRRMGAALSHTYPLECEPAEDECQSYYQSNTLFDYNDHTIQAESRWVMKGDRVDSYFRIDSPTHTIAPIFGELKLNSNDAAQDVGQEGDGSNMQFVLSWQRKNITAVYHFKSDTSFIEIDTPFEGIEKTILKYSVVTGTETVYLSATVDVFRQNNSITLSWTNAADSTTLWLDLMSPMTGGYYVYFTHSMLLGKLNENFNVRGPENKELLKMRIEGDIMPLMTMNLTASLVLVDHDAMLTVINSKEPLLSNAIATWNGRSINSKMRLEFDHSQLSLLNWLVESNLFAPVNVSYERRAQNCLTKIILPNDYSITNKYVHSGSQWDNVFHLRTPNLRIEFTHEAGNTSLAQRINAQLNDKQIDYMCKVSASFGRENAVQFDGMYNFHDGANLVHSYNVSSHLEKTSAKEQFNLAINSTSTLNGYVGYQRHISSKLRENAVRITCKFSAYCDLEADADHQHFLWHNKLSNKKLDLAYTTEGKSVVAKLQSSYDHIPNGELSLEYSYDRLSLLANAEDYHLSVVSDIDAHNAAVFLRKRQEDLVRFVVEFPSIRSFNSSLEANTFTKLNATFSYTITSRQFELTSLISTPFSNAEFLSKFDNQQNKLVYGFVKAQYNTDIYYSTITYNDKQLDLALKTPTEEYNGKVHNQYNSLLHTLDVELSSRKSRNFLSFIRKLDNLEVKVGSDYLKIQPREIKYTWDSWSNLSGEGQYIDGSDKYRFTMRSAGFKDWSFAYYLPSGLLFFNLNVNGRFESKRDFDATVDGTWDGHKIRFDLKNYFGSYYQTTFNLVVPIKGWSRTSLDCTLNERKIGIALQARNHHMSIVAGKSGDDMLRIEYMGETLLEMSSSEGHLTLRTTSYLGKYRLFIQTTYTPGIYVFSILKDGENLVSVMLQNYSINDVLHYKGKLMAPEIIPNNSTLSVEFMANVELWKFFNVKMKKDQKPLLELGWENRRHRHGLDGSLGFQSQIDPALNFQLKPSFSISDANELDVDVEIKYPCEKHTECSFSFVLTPTRMVCRSFSSVEALNFQIQSNFNYGRAFLNADFEFNDFKHTNIGFNLSAQLHSHMSLTGAANFEGESALITLNLNSRNVQMEVGTSHGSSKYYLLARSRIQNDQLVLDLHLAQNQLFPNITAKANVSLKQGTVTVTKNRDKYEGTWRASIQGPRVAFAGKFLQNGARLGGVEFENTQIRGHNFQSDSSLHITIADHKIDAVVKGLLANDTAKAMFALLTTWEPLKRLDTGITVRFTESDINLEQHVHFCDREFTLNANSVASNGKILVQLMCKPWGQNQLVVNETFTARLNYDRIGERHSFVVDPGLGSAYAVHIYRPQGGHKDYVIRISTTGGKIVALLKYNTKYIDLDVTSIGPIEELVLKLNANRFMMRGRIMGYGQSFLFQEGVFGLQLDGPEKVTVLYKTKREQPSGIFDDYQDHEVVMLAAALDHKVMFTMKDAVKTLELRASPKHYLTTIVEDNDVMYKLTANTHSGPMGTLEVHKNYNHIKNNIYLPFEVMIEMETPTFRLISNGCTVSLSRNQQHVDVRVGSNHFRFAFDHIAHGSKNGLLVHYERGLQRLHFEIGRNHIVEFALNNADLLALRYDVYNGLAIKLKQKLQSNDVQYDLAARSVHDITFELLTDGERSILWKSFLDDSSMTYQFMAPEWKLLRVFDITMSWVNNTDGKVFGVALKLDSEYTGATEVGSVYEERQFLLNIESYFKAPFLEGLETFYGKIYIPAEFRPHLEFVIPGQTFKLYYDHHSNFMETEVICRNDHFFLMMNNTDGNNQTLQIGFPDERFKSFSYSYGAHGLLQIVLNDEYSVRMKRDWSYLKVKTPHQEYEHFGYLCERTFDNERSEFKLVIWHPGYVEPLGVAFRVHLREDDGIQIVYSLHAPFVIHGYDHATFNVTTKLLPHGVDAHMGIRTNSLEIEAGLAFILSGQRQMLQAKAQYNHQHYLGLLNIEPEKVYIVVGDPRGNGCNFLEEFPDFERTAPERVYAFYLGVQGDSFDVLAQLPGTQPFSMRRAGSSYVKLIWDLRRPNQTALGLKVIPWEAIELYVADNRIAAEQHTNETSSALSLRWNDLNVEYSSFRSNVSIRQGAYNLTSIRGVRTPLGALYLTQRTFTAAAQLIDRVEVDWTGRPNSAPSKLIFNYEITPGSLTSSVSSSMLAHPLMLHVDMGHFRAIPSKLDATFRYSNQPDKTISFSMRYNKTLTADATGGSVLTDRVFLLKHLSSKLDYELYFNAIRREEFSNGSVTLKYRDFGTDKVEVIRGSVKVDHSKFGVHAGITTARNRFDLVATSTAGVKRHGFLVHIEINDKDPLNLECSYSFQKDSPSVSLIAAYGTSRKYLFYAGMPSEKEITTKLGHEMYGRTSLDAMAMVKLNTSQILWMKVLWKDSLYAPFQEAILDEYNDLRYVIEAMGKELIDVIHDDVGKEFISDAADIKNEVVRQAMSDLQKGIAQLRERDVCLNNSNSICGSLAFSELRNLVDILKESLAFFYDALECVVQTSFKSVQILLDAVNLEIDKGLKDIKNIQHIKVDAKAILKRGINTARRSLKEMETVVVKLLDDFDQYVGGVKAQVVEFFDPCLSLVDDFIVYLEQRLAVLQIAVLETMDNIQQYIYNLREIRTMFSMYYSYINWLEELHVIKMLDPVTDVLEEILETIIQDVKRLLDHYKPYLDALGDALFGRYDGIQQLPPIVEVREHVNRIYHKTIWVWNYHNMTQALKSCVRKLSKDVDNVLSFMEFDDFSGSGSELEYAFGYNYVFRPENRLIEISQPLPVEWEAFNKSPSFANYPLYQRIQGKSEQFIKFSKSRYDLIDMLENFVVDLYEPSIAPTTLNYAMMIGKSHYTTFNGLNYNFLSNCSYLLASDFKTRSFSLIVNYRNSSGTTRKSYEILSNDSSFEIFSEDRVTLDGRKVELPIIHKQVTITRERENIVAESSRGFKMICYFHYDFCTVQLSGWLFGKTAGLLGTLDNEQYTDAMSAQKSTTGIVDFLRSWQLDAQTDAACALHVSPDIQPDTEYVRQLCGLWFNDTKSPLKKCFDAVDPKSYEETCYNELKANPLLKICAPAAAYVHRCRQAKIAIEMPDFCVTCQNDIGYTEEIFDGHNNKTVDVVFISELDCYNGTSVTRTLPELLDRKLQRKHFAGNRFATVGYGGHALPKPHVHTHGGQIWARGQHVEVPSRLSGGSRNVKSKFTAVDALKYAAHLEYRVGVPKLFILLQCEVATDIGNSPDIYNMLGEKDITLHVLKPRPFGAQRTHLLGIDLNEPILAARGPPVPINQVINQIDDVYSGLALSTNGTIFDLSALSTSERGAQWAKALLRRMRASPCQKCKCVQDHGGVGKIECSRCLAPAVKQFLNEYEEGNKMHFGDSDDNQ